MKTVGVELLWWGQNVVRDIGWLGGISPHSNHIPELEHWDTRAILHASLISHSLHLHQPPPQLLEFALRNFLSGV